MQRLLRRTALPVDGHARHARRQLRGQRRHAADAAALLSGLEHAAHDHVFHQRWISVAALEQRVDDLRGQVDRVPARKPAAAFAACRPGGRDDISFCHDTFFYRTTLMKLSSDISAVITGGASGLGAATARRLAQHGVRVALFDLNQATGEALARELGGVFCKVDVTSEEQVDAGFAMARAAIGQERVLVNCAGTGNAIKTASRDKTTGAIKSFPTADFDRIIQINLVGTFRCTAKSAAGMMTLPVLDDGDRGAIVNTAPVAAQDGQIGQASYSASKAGIVGMTLPIARDLICLL